MSVKTPSKLEKILSEGHLAVTSECGPPRGSNAEHIIKKAELIKEYVDAINITDNQTSMTRLCSLASCIRLKLMGLEPVLQMVTRDRNRIALQSDILGAASFDINNILCLSGDHQSFGDCPQGQNVHDIDSIQLIQTVRHMRDEGKFLGGDDLDQKIIDWMVAEFKKDQGIDVRGCIAVPNSRNAVGAGPFYLLFLRQQAIRFRNNGFQIQRLRFPFQFFQAF